METILVLERHTGEEKAVWAKFRDVVWNYVITVVIIIKQLSLTLSLLNLWERWAEKKKVLYMEWFEGMTYSF